MTQIKHKVQTVSALLTLHKELTEKLENFKLWHPELVYDVNLLIGEETHVIEINLRLDNASKGTGSDSKEPGEEV